MAVVMEPFDIICIFGHLKKNCVRYIKKFFHRNYPKNMFIQKMRFNLANEKKSGALHVFLLS